MAQEAGDFMLHVWMDSDGSGVRKWLTGSPFLIRVSGVRASALGSILNGTQAYIKNLPAADQQAILEVSPGKTPKHERDSAENMDIKGGGGGSHSKKPKHGDKKAEVAVPKLLAGERIMLAPQLKDEFGNASFASDGELRAFVIAPDGEHTIPITMGKGLGSYELSYDVHLKGLHILCVELNGENIQRSPFHFAVTPGPAVGSKSSLRQLTPTAYVQQPCVLVLESIDKFGNTVDEGGAAVNARGVGTGVQACTVADMNDGTYNVTFTSNVVGEARVIVRLDNQEMPPLLVVFTQGDKGKDGKGKKGEEEDSKGGGEDEKGGNDDESNGEAGALPDVSELAIDESAEKGKSKAAAASKKKS